MVFVSACFRSSRPVVLASRERYPITIASRVAQITKFAPWQNRDRQIELYSLTPVRSGSRGRSSGFDGTRSRKKRQQKRKRVRSGRVGGGRANDRPKDRGALFVSARIDRVRPRVFVRRKNRRSEHDDTTRYNTTRRGERGSGPAGTMGHDRALPDPAGSRRIRSDPAEAYRGSRTGNHQSGSRATLPRDPASVQESGHGSRAKRVAGFHARLSGSLRVFAAKGPSVQSVEVIGVSS